MVWLQYLENTGFAIWVRESGSLWSFPGILLLHTCGMAVLVGIIAALDLRILGYIPALPLAPLKQFFPMMWAAFSVNAVTGTMLLVADATTKLRNPDFAVKMIFIVLAVINLRMIQTRVFHAPDIEQGVLPPYAKTLAVVSLVCWLGAITSGRLLAYIGPVSGLN